MTVSFSPRVLERLLRIDPVTKPVVYSQVFESANPFSVTYWLEVIFSCSIATLGLILNSPAVVIGAMLISPLMGPIIGAGLALAAGDLYLFVRASLNLLLSSLASILLAALIVFISPFHSATNEILARTQPNLLDLGVAAFSGLAGTLIVLRGASGGGVTALPGVAIAVALMPPLCTVGFGVGAGWQVNIIRGAGLLYLTNLVAIVSAALLVFWLIRMEPLPFVSQGAPTRDLLDRALAHAHRSKLMRALPGLPLRLALPLIALTVVAVPLSRALIQVRDEATARTLARTAVRSLAPPDEIVSQQTDVTRDLIRVRIVTTANIDAARLERARRELEARTGKTVSFLLRRVAAEDDIALLRQSLTPPPPPPPKDELASIRQETFARIDESLRAIWPEQSAKLTGVLVGLRPDTIEVRAQYEADRDLDDALAEALALGLRRQLHTEALSVVLENQTPPRTRRR